MILEVVEIVVQSQRELEFESALNKGRGILLSAAGCHGVTLLRGIESPSRYLLQIEWDSVDAHVAFTRSPAIVEFRSLIAPHFAERPRMEHFGAVH